MKIKTLQLGALVLLLCLLFSACAPDTTTSSTQPEPESGWHQAAAVPFTGYICWYEQQGENDAILMQFPLVYPIGTQLNLEEVRSIRLGGAHGSGMDLIGEVTGEGFTMATLLFYTRFDEPGEYRVDTLEIELQDGTLAALPLEEFVFDIQPLPPEDEAPWLKLRGAFSLSRDYSTYTFEYENLTDREITIQDLSWDSRFYTGIQDITVYQDSDLKNLVEGPPVIPPGERRTVVFTMDVRQDTYREHMYYLFSPFIYFTNGQEESRMPALSGPMVIQTQFPQGYQASLLQ